MSSQPIRARIMQVLARHRRQIVYFFVSGIAFLIAFKRFSETLKARHFAYQLPRRRDPAEKCKAQMQVAFAKTHKTGSSTLQNIIFRWPTISQLEKRTCALCLSKLIGVPLSPGMENGTIWCLPFQRKPMSSPIDSLSTLQ